MWSPKHLFCYLPCALYFYHLSIHHSPQKSPLPSRHDVYPGPRPESVLNMCASDTVKGASNPIHSFLSKTLSRLSAIPRFKWRPRRRQHSPQQQTQLSNEQQLQLPSHEPTPRYPLMDADFFPHIIDHILDYLVASHPAAALSVATTCRSWHAMIMSRLFSHLKLDIESDHFYVRLPVRNLFHTTTYRFSTFTRSPHAH